MNATIQKMPATDRTRGAPDQHALAPTANPYVSAVLLDLPNGSALPVIHDVWKPASSWSALVSRVFKGEPKTLRSVVERAAQSNGSQTRFLPNSVLVELPEAIFAHDRRTGGYLQAAMAGELAKLHQQDLGGMMPKGTQARYMVKAASDLPANKMRVRLGPAIYVPEAHENPAWRIELSRDGGDWTALTPVWLFENQPLFILSGSVHHGSEVCPDWPFEPHVGLVMVNQPGGQVDLDLSAEPLRSLDIVANPKAGWTVVREPGGSGAGRGACLYLKVTRLQQVAPAPVEPLVAKPPMQQETPLPLQRKGRPPAKDPLLQPTEPVFGHLPPLPPQPEQRPLDSVDHAPTRHSYRADAGGSDFFGIDNSPTKVAQAPRRIAKMTLRGLGIQRPSFFGGEALQFGLDSGGRVVRVDSVNAQHRFELIASPVEELRLLLNHGAYRVLTLGESLPLDGGRAQTTFQPLPGELADGYLGWMSLPQGPSEALENTITVGRKHIPMLALRPLAQAGTVVAKPASKTTPDSLGMSGDHATLSLLPEGLNVQTLGQATAVRLDSYMRFVGHIGPRSQPAAVLQDGDHLLLAHYLWKFELALT